MSELFYSSSAWQQVRYEVLKAHRGTCMCCGKDRRNAMLTVDHILPISSHPELALEFDNLQVLCYECNRGKSNRDRTDWTGDEPRERLVHTYDPDYHRANQLVLAYEGC